MWRALWKGVGKTRYTQNQDYFKLGGSSPGADMAAAARRAFGMERARERLGMFLRFGPARVPRAPRPQATVSPTEVLPPEEPPETPIAATVVPSDTRQVSTVGVPPFQLMAVAWDVAHWPLLLLEQGWRLLRRTGGDLVQKGEQRTGRYLGLG